MKEFKIGDKVQLISKSLIGVIKSMTSFKVVLLDEDGFEQEFLKTEIVEIHSKWDYEKTVENIEMIKNQKEVLEDETRSKKNIKKSEKEVDLHIHHLIDYTRNMSNFEMISLQMDTVKSVLKNTDKNYYKSIIFIHGKGIGKLKQEIENYLEFHQYRFEEASFQKYGIGALKVILSS